MFKASGPRLAVAVAGGGSFTTAFAASLSNVVNPAIAREFGLSVAATAWIPASYLLTICVLLVSGGRLGDRLGHERSFAAGLGIFALGALTSTAAPALWVLLLGRVVAGVGAALLMATGPALLATRVPEGQAGGALGAQASLTYLGLLVGPTAGATLAALGGWRGAMFSVAVLTLPIAAGTRVLGGSEARLLTPRARPALLPSLRALLAAPGYRSALLASCLQYAASYSLTFLLPFQLEHTLGQSTERVGLWMGISPLAMALLSPLSGKLADRIGSPKLAPLGALGLAAGLLATGLAVTSHAFALLAAALVVVGSGAACFVPPNTRLLMTRAPREMRGLAGSLVGLTRQLGMALGVALATLCVSALARTNGAVAGTRVAEPTFALALTASAVCALLGAATSRRRCAE